MIKAEFTQKKGNSVIGYIITGFSRILLNFTQIWTFVASLSTTTLIQIECFRVSNATCWSCSRQLQMFAYAKSPYCVVQPWTCTCVFSHDISTLRLRNQHSIWQETC
jgi:hypothetical protein